MPKRPPEYIEGDEAVQRFEGLMKRVMTPRKEAGQTVKESAPAYGKKKRKRKG